MHSDLTISHIEHVHHFHLRIWCTQPMWKNPDSVSWSGLCGRCTIWCMCIISEHEQPPLNIPWVVNFQVSYFELCIIIPRSACAARVTVLVVSVCVSVCYHSSCVVYLLFHSCMYVLLCSKHFVKKLQPHDIHFVLFEQHSYMIYHCILIHWL